MVKEDVEDFNEFPFSLLFHSSFLFAWHLPIFCKKWTGRIVSNFLFLREVTRCYNRQWEFSVTKSVCYKDVFVNSFCSATFRLGNSLVIEPFLWLTSKWLLNYELIPSSQRQDDSEDSQNLVYSSWSLLDIDNLIK